MIIIMGVIIININFNSNINVMLFLMIIIDHVVSRLLLLSL